VCTGHLSVYCTSQRLPPVHFRPKAFAALWSTQFHVERGDVWKYTIYSLDLGLANSTLFTQLPTPSKATSTTSPSLSQSWGFLPIPTPDGVPVKITSPGSRVVPWLKNAIVFAMPKIWSDVFPSCSVLPLTLVDIFKFWGSLIKLLLTIPGPYYGESELAKIRYG